MQPAAGDPGQGGQGKDVYAEARALGSWLWESGLPEWANRIDDIVVGGTTATEILMGLRWALRELLAHEARQLAPGLRFRAEELASEIGTALASNGH